VPVTKVSEAYRTYTKWLRGTHSVIDRGLDLGYELAKRPARIIQNTGDRAIERMLEFTSQHDSVYGTIHLTETHIPYEPREELITEYMDTFDYNEYADIDDELVADRVSNTISNDGDPPVKEVLARYDACATEADERIGELITGLEKQGVYDDTLLIITADHGESLLDHGIFFDHHGLYDCSTQIPLVIKAPTADANSDEPLVELIDIAPTVLDYLDVDTTVEFDGDSLTPLIEGRTDSWDARDAVLSIERHAQKRDAIRTNENKLITTVGPLKECTYCAEIHGSETELYDLSTDPAEQTNIADHHSDLLEELQTRKDELRDQFTLIDIETDEHVVYDDEEAVEKKA
jgi:arylsulfatase A-like enzyme